MKRIIHLFASKRLHATFTFFWIGAILPTLLWWHDSILWVAFMSIWANIVSHATGYTAAKSAEEK